MDAGHIVGLDYLLQLHVPLLEPEIPAAIL